MKAPVSIVYPELKVCSQLGYAFRCCRSILFGHDCSNRPIESLSILLALDLATESELFATTSMFHLHSVSSSVCTRTKLTNSWICNYLGK